MPWRPWLAPRRACSNRRTPSSSRSSECRCWTISGARRTLLPSLVMVSVRSASSAVQAGSTAQRLAAVCICAYQHLLCAARARTRRQQRSLAGCIYRETTVSSLIVFLWVVCDTHARPQRHGQDSSPRRLYRCRTAPTYPLPIQPWRYGGTVPLTRNRSIE